MSRDPSYDAARLFSYERLNLLADKYTAETGGYLVSSAPDNAFVQLRKIRGALSDLQKDAFAHYGNHTRFVAEHLPLFEEKYIIPEDESVSIGFGWKLHIGVSEAVLGNVEKAWNVVAPLLVKHGVPTAKVIKAGSENSLYRDPPDTQINKQITIYLGTSEVCNKHRETIFAFIQELNQILLENDIVPGCEIPESARIKEEILYDSPYLTYRCDSTRRGIYIDGAGHFPYDKKDPGIFADAAAMPADHDEGGGGGGAGGGRSDDRDRSGSEKSDPLSEESYAYNANTTDPFPEGAIDLSDTFHSVPYARNTFEEYKAQILANTSTVTPKK